VFVATSDTRETYKYDNRKKFLQKTLRIAADRPLIFKLHPNENIERSTNEIRRLAPHALVFTDGNAHHMVANCDVLITQYSSLTFTGIALGKEVHAYFDIGMLRRLVPIQNGGISAKNIAEACRGYLD
jgi:CDP-glycerol glycerophosphotransferase (TagB/SpsB family)